MTEPGTGTTPDVPPLGAGRGPGAAASTRVSVVYLAWTWATIWHRNPAATARLALREDPGRAVADALLLVASMASVLAIGLAITAGRASGTRTSPTWPSPSG